MFSQHPLPSTHQNPRAQHHLAFPLFMLVVMNNAIKLLHTRPLPSEIESDHVVDRV